MVSHSQNDQDGLQAVVMQQFAQAKAFQQMQGDSDVEMASGPLRVLMVTLDLSDPFQESSTSDKARAVEPVSSDIWLVLEIGSVFSLPVKANQVVKPHRATSSYIIPSSDVPGAAIKLTIPSGSVDEVEQFEDLLADYCAFQLDAKGKGTFELIDEKGQMLGTIDGPWTLEEDSTMYQAGHEKDPVMVDFPEEGSSKYYSNEKISVSAAPRDADGTMPTSYHNDWLLKGAHMVSKTMVGGSSWAGKKMVDAADSYVRKTSPLPGSTENEKVEEKDSLERKNTTDSNLTTSGRPAVTFSPRTHATSQQIKSVSGTVTQVSTRTREAVLGVASKVGDQIGKTTGIQRQAKADGTFIEPKGWRGVFNRSLIAANVVLDGVTQSAETLLRDGGKAGGAVIEHRYGSEAKVISGNTASIGRSAFVVYKDVNGVRRKALLKIASGTIRARAPDGSEVVLQQEGSQSVPIAVPATSSTQVAQPPSYEKSSGLEKRDTDSDIVDELSTGFTVGGAYPYSLDLFESPIFPRTPHRQKGPCPSLHSYSYFNTFAPTADDGDTDTPLTELEFNQGEQCTKDSTSAPSFLFDSTLLSSTCDDDALIQSPFYTVDAQLYPYNSDEINPQEAFQSSLFGTTLPHDFLPWSPQTPSRIDQDLPSSYIMNYARNSVSGFTFHGQDRQKLQNTASSPPFYHTPTSSSFPYSPRSMQYQPIPISSIHSINHHNHQNNHHHQFMSHQSLPRMDSLGHYSLKREVEPSIRWTMPRTPSSINTITPRRTCKQEYGIKEDSNETLRSSIGDEVTEEEDMDDVNDAYRESPLLRASQESSPSLLNYLPRLDVGEYESLKESRLGSTPQKRKSQDVYDSSPSSSQSSGMLKKYRQEDVPTSARLCITGDAQLDNAASVLLSLAQIKAEPMSFPSLKSSPIQSNVRHHHHHHHSEGFCSSSGEDDIGSTSSDTDNSLSLTTSSEKGDGTLCDNTIRLLPRDIPTIVDLFPRIYQRFHVSSVLDDTLFESVHGTMEASKVKDNNSLQLKAIKGRKVIAERNDVKSPFDLYTPRWVRGTGREKEGLCPICYEDEGGELMKWKRIKTSEYNYHLINQHGISPHSLLPYDPPIAFRNREVNAAAAGHRSIIIQGKCHACKKYIDMQGKYLTPVKVPEIYWWKHARQCHKGKESFTEEDGVFVQDEFYHRVKAAFDSIDVD